MNYPFWDVPHIGSGWVIGLIAIFHMMIALFAVGGGTYLVLAEQKVRALFAQKPELTASEIRQELGTTRKYIIPLLNYFDSRGVTQRKGEIRILRQKVTSVQ